MTNDILKKLSKSFSQKKFKKYFGSSNAPLFSASVSAETTTNTSGTTGDASIDQDAKSIQDVKSPSSASNANANAQFSTATRQVYKSFMVLLEQAEVQSKKRLAMGDAIDDSITKVLKEFYKLKTSLTRKNIEFGVKYQHEIWIACEELERARTIYDKASKDADAAHKKYNDSLVKPKGLLALKNIMTGKDAAQVTEKLFNKHKLKVRVLNTARNNYLLSITAMNALQKLYDQDDLPQLITKTDGFFYDVLASVLHKYTVLETDLCADVGKCMATIQAELADISRDKDVHHFLDTHASLFRSSPLFAFEAVGQDETREIVADDSARLDLGRRLGDLMAQDNGLFVHQEIKEKEMKGAEMLVEINSAASPIQSGGSVVSPLELKQDIQNALDLIKCQRMKLIQQIKMIKPFNVTPIMPENIEQGKQLAIIETSHKSTCDSELSTTEGEEVEVVAVDGPLSEGWIRIKNKEGKSGTVPSSSLQLISKPPPKSSAESRIVVAVYDYKATEENELSFNAGDEIECAARVDVDDEDWEGKLIRTGETGFFPRLLTKGWEAVAAHAVNDMASLARVASGSRRPLSLTGQKKGRARSASESRQGSGVDVNPAILNPLLSGLVAQMAKVGEIKEDGGGEEEDEDEKRFSAVALYKYEATCDGELSIEAGERIASISKATGSDQWWSGTGTHGTGQFPASYVTTKHHESKGLQKVKALYDFSPVSPGELGFKAGDVISLRQSDDVDWWDGELNGTVGAFPAAYVEKIE